MKRAKQTSGINSDGQELTSEMIRIKIGKNEYKSLKGFQVKQFLTASCISNV